MKLKEYSMQIKKNIAVFLHLMSLVLVVTGISFVYLNSHYGSGLSWLKNERYEDSPQFAAQLQTDIERIFKYADIRDVFEYEGILDMLTPVVGVSYQSDTEVSYSLDELVQYAKSQGYYLDNNYDIVHDSSVTPQTESAPPRVLWRAYEVENDNIGPGAAYVQLIDLSLEVLEKLGDYYKIYQSFIANPSNMSFQLCYQADDGEQSLYTNAPDKSVTALREDGQRFFFLTGDAIIMDTNLTVLPQNVATLLDNHNPYGTDTYYMIVSVDTSYSDPDSYARENANYLELRRHFLEGLAYLACGLLGMLVTFLYLVSVSGYRTSEKKRRLLTSMDMITTEACIVLTALATLFGLFLGEKVGYRLLHLLVSYSSWDFADRMMQAVIIYLMCLVGIFSLLRRYKAGFLWKNSMLCHFLNDIEKFRANTQYTSGLALGFVLFVLEHVVIISAIWLLRGQLQYAFVKLLLPLLALFLIISDFLVFRSMFYSAEQRDKIAEAVDNIASGDTSYQIDLTGFTGKELALAQSMNHIGIGLENALQEQIKSERFKADLITNVSHDIKTPLTSIISYVDLIKRANIQDPKIQSYISVLEQKSQRLKNLTEDLVEASKASSGNIKLDFANIDFVEMIHQTNGEFEEKYQTRSLELVSRLPEKSVFIEADGRRLWRVLENLYNNAFKYAMEHSRVYVDVLEDDGQVIFTIKNVSETPLNINSEELTERFVRGDESRATEGSGLGLSIAKSLTELQHGTFQIIIDGDLFKVEVAFPVKKD